MINIVGKITCCNGFRAFFHPFHAFQAAYCQTALHFMRHLTEWVQNRNLISVVEKNPALTTELTWNSAKPQIFFSISLDSYYYYNYSAHLNIIDSHALECSNPSCFSSSISLHTQLQTFLLPHDIGDFHIKYYTLK